MPYVVTRQIKKPMKPNVYDFLLGKIVRMSDDISVYTRTFFYKELKPSTIRERMAISSCIELLEEFNNKYSEILEKLSNTNVDYEKQVSLYSKFRKQFACISDKEEREKKITEEVEKKLSQEKLGLFDLYYTFFIPKRKKGEDGRTKWRRIDAPVKALANAQKELAKLFSSMMCGNTYHTSAYAYIKGRDIVGANKKHLDHGSRFSLQLDFSNFFGSITPEFTYNMLKMIFPFSEIIKEENGEQALKQALNICFLDGVLPQGTPISPMLTNLIMIPIDHKIQNQLFNEYNAVSNEGVRHKFIYTRYADDIKISNRINFKPFYKEGKMYSNVKSQDGKSINLEDYIIKVLKSFNAPLKINKEKTKYTSIYGSNWSLGILTNQQQELSLGHESRDNLSAKLWDFANKFLNGERMTPKEAQQLFGILNYHRYIEKDKTEKIISKIEQKLNIISLTDMIKACMKGE